MVKLVILFVHYDLITEFEGQSIDINLISKSVLLSNKECNGNVLRDVAQLDFWWREASVVSEIRRRPVIIKLNELLLTNNLTKMKQLLDGGRHHVVHLLLHPVRFWIRVNGLCVCIVIDQIAEIAVKCAKFLVSDHN